MFVDENEDGWVDPDPVNGEVLQETHFYPFGLTMAGASSTAAPAVPNNYLFTGKEYQNEYGIGWIDFGARMYDASVGRWNGVDALGENTTTWTPYRYGFNNPLTFTDPDGNQEVDWFPDKDGNLIAEEGDDEGSLAVFLDISIEKAQDILVEQEYFNDITLDLNLDNGDIVKLDNTYTRNLARDGGLVEGDTRLNYNCWGSACAGVSGKNIKVGVGIDSPVTFDNILSTDFKSVDKNDAKFGETILRFTTDTPYSNIGFDVYETLGLLSRDPDAIGGSLHGAVFYGNSKDGTTYIYTKNGWDEAPRIMKLKDLENDSYYRYGEVRGLGGKSGYYNEN